MKFEMLVALNVTDEKSYADYRREITPILTTYGGGFRYDFRVSETLRSEVDHPITRVFTIYFGSQEQSDAFFADPAYLAAKKRYYAPAVAGTTIIARYEK